MIHIIPPLDRWPHLYQQGLCPKPISDQCCWSGYQLGSIGLPAAWTELGSSAGNFAGMRTMLHHLTLLYVLHCAVLS